MIDPRFRHVELEYQRLKEELGRGALTPAAFEEALSGLTIESGGHFWMIGANSGRWYRSEGNAWLEAAAPRVAGPESAAPSSVATPHVMLTPAAAVGAQLAAAPAASTAAHILLGGGIGCLVPAIFAAAGTTLAALTNSAVNTAAGGLLFGSSIFISTLVAVAVFRRAPLWVVAIAAGLWIPVGMILVRFAPNYWLHSGAYAVTFGAIAALVATAAGAILRLILPKR